MIGIVSSRGNHDREAIMAPCDYGKKRNEIASDRIVDVAHGWIPIFFFFYFLLFLVKITCYSIIGQRENRAHVDSTWKSSINQSKIRAKLDSTYALDETCCFLISPHKTMTSRIDKQLGF
jgi:hypothetical protein